MNKRKKEPSFKKILDFYGEAPCSRHGHTAVIDEKGGGVMIIFGGCDEKGRFCSDLSFYNIETREWTQMNNLPGMPNGRQFHSAVLHDRWMYIFAGNSNGYYNDLHRFHVDSLKWEGINTIGEKPSPRAGHTAIVHNNGMYVFGGYDKNGLLCHDLFEFTFDLQQWKLIIPSGNPPDIFHHAAVTHLGSMYTFGGRTTTESTSQSSRCELQEYRFASGTWSDVNTVGIKPSRRWGHKMVIFNNVLYLIGGRDAVANANDLYEYHFATQEWKRKNVDGIEPRCFFSAVLHDQSLHIFGGSNICYFSLEGLYFCDLIKFSSPGTLVEDYRKLLNDPELADVVFIFPGNENSQNCSSPPSPHSRLLKNNEMEKTVNIREETQQLSEKEIIQTENERVIYAHRNILVSRCKLFSAMFRTDMKESRNGEIIISNISYDAFYSVLEYLYSGQLFASPSDLLQILQSSDLYQLPHLKRDCERKLKRYVDVGNAVYMLQIADKFKATVLKRYCLHFIAKNLSDVQSREGYQMLEPELHNEIMKVFIFIF